MKTLPLAVIVLATSCLQPTFEVLVPAGDQGTLSNGADAGLKLFPEVMLLIDTSGSMANPIVAGCTGTECATRMSELKSGISSWLQAKSSSVRVGLATFPDAPSGPVQCGTTSPPSVGFPAPTNSDEGTQESLARQAERVKSVLSMKIPRGGTPTASALLQMMPSFGPIPRERFVVLVTDGVPNCNPENVNNVCVQPNDQCQCTTFGNPLGCGMPSLCSLGCLDATASLGAVAALANAGIKTIVVSFGPDLTGPVASTLFDSMARAGRAPRSCPRGTTAECGGFVCRADKTCEKGFYSVADGSELAAVLSDLF
jgi:von Willebrand factor type A domain